MMIMLKCLKSKCTGNTKPYAEEEPLF